MEIEAIEEAFIRGDWTEVLRQSKEALVARAAAADGDARDGATPQGEEALVSMYLQSIFELGSHDEAETAAMVMQSLAPLPFEVSVQWIKFLIAMHREPVALELLNEMLERFAKELEMGVASSEESRSRYVQTTELLVFHVLLPSESVDVVRSYITRDQVLDEATKERLLHAANATVAPPPQTPLPAAHAEPAAPTRGFSATQSELRRNTHQHASERRHAEASGADPAADLVTIGGTALAVAALAVGAYRYRDNIRDAVAEIGPAVSKGLADAKYALFES